MQHIAIKPNTINEPMTNFIHVDNLMGQWPAYAFQFLMNNLISVVYLNVCLNNKNDRQALDLKERLISNAT